MSQDSMLDAIEAAIPDLSYGRQAFRAALEMARAQLPSELQFVAGPGTAPLGGVRPDDLLVRINPGEPVAPLVGRITSEATWSSGDPAWDAEYAGPGYYARVAPVYGPGVAADRSRGAAGAPHPPRSTHRARRHRVAGHRVGAVATG